jgi:hypothetical protein
MCSSIMGVYFSTLCHAHWVSQTWYALAFHRIYSCFLLLLVPTRQYWYFSDSFKIKFWMFLFLSCFELLFIYFHTIFLYTIIFLNKKYFKKQYQLHIYFLPGHALLQFSLYFCSFTSFTVPFKCTDRFDLSPAHNVLLKHQANTAWFSSLYPLFFFGFLSLFSFFLFSGQRIIIQLV